VKIGKIPYANLFPIFYALQKQEGFRAYEFIEGVPSELNKMIREGFLDISPSSSIEYILMSSRYHLIDGHSISSNGPIKSILLFSRIPIEKLDGKRISYSFQSETSVALLDVILKKFYGIQCELKVSHRPEDSYLESFLLIGDDALKYKAKCNRQETISKGINKNINYNLSAIDYSLFIYDLGELWFKHTGLPFVFALWIARKDLDRKNLARFQKDLDLAKKFALNNFSEIAKHSSLKEFMSEKSIVSYWKLIDYDLKKKHRDSLKLFERYLKEINYGSQKN
jgi:chorismate dehydratase